MYFPTKNRSAGGEISKCPQVSNQTNISWSWCTTTCVRYLQLL